MKIARLVSFFLAGAAAVVLQAVAVQAAVKTQWIDYKQGATALSGYLVYDDAVQGKQPGVLMIHDRSGFSEGTLADARMIAGLGYVVFAEDMFGKGFVPKSVPEMMDTIAIYDKDRPLMRERALAGFDVLKAQPMVDPAKLAGVGYCFGGTVGIELKATLKIRKLLIPLNEKNVKNIRFAQLRYTRGTRRIDESESRPRVVTTLRDKER